MGDGTTLAVERLTDVAAHSGPQRELEQIAAAQRAIAEGSYGTCTSCGEQIAPGRLEARPASTRCVRCASA